MKKTMIALMAMCAMLFSVGAFAQNADVRGLTDAQKAEIDLQIAKMKADAAKGITNPEANISATIRKEAEAWGEMGANMGRAVVGAAKEIGVAANEFAETPLGKVTVGVVVYKVIGKDVLGVLVGSMVLFFGGLLGAYVIVKYRWGSKFKYDYKPYLFGLWQKRVVVESYENDDGAIARIVVGVIIIGLSLVIGLNTIF